MVVAEYCGNCDKRTLRKVGPCPECTPENVESQTTDTQQLNADFDIDKQKLTLSTENELINQITEQVCDFKEERIKSALIKLGWTPPKPVDKDSTIR